MSTEMKERFEELCKDEEYVKYVLSLENAEAMSKELESKDIDLSPEEIHQIGSLLRKKANGELSDEELEQVSGGIEVLGFMLFGIIGGILSGGGYIVCEVVKGC